MFKNQLIKISALSALGFISPAVIVACSQSIIWNNLLPEAILAPEQYNQNHYYYQSPLNDEAMSNVLKNYLEPYIALQKPDLQWNDLQIQIQLQNSEKAQELIQQMRQRLGLIDRQAILNLPTNFKDFFIVTNQTGSLWKAQIAPVQPLINPFTNKPIVLVEVYYNTNVLSLVEVELAKIDPLFTQSQFSLVKTSLNDLLKFDLPKDWNEQTTYSDYFRTDLTWMQFYSQAILQNLQFLSQQPTTNEFSLPKGVLPPILSDRTSFLEQFGFTDNGDVQFSTIRINPSDQGQFGLWINFYLFGNQWKTALNDYYENWIAHIDFVKTRRPNNLDRPDQDFALVLNRKIRQRFGALTRLWSQWQQQSILKTFQTLPAITGFKADLSITSPGDFNSKPLNLKLWQIQFPDDKPMAIDLELGRLMLVVGAIKPVADPQVQTTDQGVLSTTTAFSWPMQNGLFVSPFANEYEKHYNLLVGDKSVMNPINPADLQLKQIFGKVFNGNLSTTPALKG